MSPYLIAPILLAAAALSAAIGYTLGRHNKQGGGSK